MIHTTWVYIIFTDKLQAFLTVGGLNEIKNINQQQQLTRALVRRSAFAPSNRPNFSDNSIDTGPFPLMETMPRPVIR